jgi:hypothetical protein
VPSQEHFLRQSLARSALAAVGVFAIVAVSRAQLSETGLGNVLYCNTIAGDFTVAGASTRVRDGDQTNPFALNVNTIPGGATVVAAYANWSYMGNNPQANNTILVNGTPVTGAKSGEGNRDLVWGMDYGFAYTADVTSLFTANGTYTVQGATDSTGAQRIGEGISVVIVYESSGAPTKEVNVYDGYTSTTTGDANGTLQFCLEYASDATLFLNGLDGQTTFTDEFFVNSQFASDQFGLGGASNAWQGTLGPGVAGRNYYDHALGNADAFMTAGDTSLTFQTIGFDMAGTAYTDAIGHSFAAMSFVPVPEPLSLLAFAPIAALAARRRIRRNRQ